MNKFLTLLALVSLPAAADILPEEVEVCQGKKSGAACALPGGGQGTCVETLVTRPDYSNGPPPTYVEVKMLSCVASAKGQARASAMPWVGAGLAVLALLAAWRERRRPQAQVSA